MSAIWRRILRSLASEKRRPAGMPGGFLESLLRKFENCRTGLPDDAIGRGGAAVERFFGDLYLKEMSHLREIIRIQEMHRSEAIRQDFFEKVDALVRKVVIPGYARLAGPFTRRERNDFYWLPAPWHGLERVGWGTLGLGLGAFIIWAPFIPLWSKEWCVIFAAGGLVFPDVRYFRVPRRYAAELNRLLARAEDEIRRTEQASYLMSEEVLDH